MQKIWDNWHTLIKDKRFFYILAFIVVFLFIVFLVSGPKNKISSSLGKDHLGGFLIAVNMTSQKVQQTSPSVEKFYPTHYILVHIHLKNNRFIGWTHLPPTLPLTMQKEQFSEKNLHRSFQKNPGKTMELLNELYGFKIVFFQEILQEAMLNIINWSGGLTLFNMKTSKMKAGAYNLSGQSFAHFWFQQLGITNKEPVDMNQYFVDSKNRFTDVAVTLMYNRSDFFRKLQQKQDKNPLYQMINQKMGEKKPHSNLSNEEFASVLEFFSDSPGPYIQTMELPLFKNSVDTEYIGIRRGEFYDGLRQKFWNALARKKPLDLYETDQILLQRMKNPVKRQQKFLMLEVMNASNVYRQAKKVRNALTKKKWKVVQFSNFPHGKIEKTVILIHNTIPIFETNLRRISKTLDLVPLVLYYTDTTIPTQATIVLGLDSK